MSLEQEGKIGWAPIIGLTGMGAFFGLLYGISGINSHGFMYIIQPLTGILAMSGWIFAISVFICGGALELSWPKRIAFTLLGLTIFVSGILGAAASGVGGW